MLRDKAEDKCVCVSTNVHAFTNHCLSVPQPGKQKKKFSSFFKSLVIELDKDLYGPDNHLVEVSANRAVHSVHRGGG